MDKKNQWTLAACGLAVMAAAVFFMTRSWNEYELPVVSDAAKGTVAATIFPIYDIARNVSAGVVEVELILPVNAEPHTYEPTPDAMRAIASAKVVYAIGHNLDGWAQKLTDANGIPTVTVDKNIALLRGGHHHHEEEGAGHDEAAQHEEEPEEGYDPHYWLSTVNAKIIASNIADDLSVRFPEQADVIAANLNRYNATLDSADREVRRVLAPVTDRRLATFHGAFGYFARDYDLTVAAVFEPYPGQEPTPRYLADLSIELKEHKLKTIYHEPAFNAATIRSFADENGLTLGVLDALGGIDNRSTLVDLLIFNATSIAEHQK